MRRERGKSGVGEDGVGTKIREDTWKIQRTRVTEGSGKSDSVCVCLIKALSSSSTSTSVSLLQIRGLRLGQPYQTFAPTAVLFQCVICR